MRLLCVALASVALTLVACDGSGSSNTTQNAVQSTPQSDAANNQTDYTANQASGAGNATSDQKGDANTLGMYCESGGCQSGSDVITATKSDGIFMSCETEQLSDYVNFVIGLLSAQKTLTGTMPNIDPQTGEPEYEGTSKLCSTTIEGKPGWRRSTKPRLTASMDLITVG